MTKYKSCPVCGGEAKLCETIGGSYAIECDECSHVTFFYDTLEEAVTKWNYRPVEDELRYELETALDTIDRLRRIYKDAVV